MKKYQITITKYNAANGLNSAAMDQKPSTEIKKIIELIYTYPRNYPSVLKQAADKQDKKLINALTNALLDKKITKSTREIQKIINNNNFEVLITLSSHGHTKALFKMLKTLPKRQKLNKTLAISLIASAAVNGHSNTVASLVKTLLLS